jgi:formylglycine-generating enzyme required for sulfatase activity
MELDRRAIAQLMVAAFTLLAILVDPAPATAQLERLRKPTPQAEPAHTEPGPSVMISAVEFWMGIDGPQGLDDERPRHPVVLDAYAMDVHEVTVGHYSTFLKKTRRTPPLFWDTLDLHEHADRPVIGVNWDDAAAYCRWAGKRLPTEAEWEHAARGTDERRYPWGNQAPTPEFANYGIGARFSYGQTLMPVGHYEKGKSPYGMYNMAGNAWEWVHDWYGTNYYEVSDKQNPRGPEEGQFKVLRGGSWSELPKYLLTYGRFKLPPNTRNSYIGFRCAK